MKIRKATDKDKKEAIKIAKKLPKWFTKEAIRNIEIDFRINNLIIAEEGGKILGFLCFNSTEGFLRIIWLAVDKDNQRKGLGTKLLKWVEDYAREIGIKTIEITTLTDKDNYKPYISTRNFYKKNGFEKVYELPKRKEGWDVEILMEKKINN